MKKTQPLSDLDRRLSAVEAALGVTKADLSGLLGMSYPQLFRWRTGRSDPTFSELQLEILGRLESSAACIDDDAAKSCLSTLRNRGRLQFLEHLLAETA